MSDPVMMAAAAAVAGKTAEAVIQGGTAAVTSLVKLVWRRFARDSQAQQALESAEDGTDDEVNRLASQLERVAAEDPEFGDRLRDWVSQNIAMTGDKAVVNQVNGPVSGGVVNQFGNIDTATFNQRLAGQHVDGRGDLVVAQAIAQDPRRWMFARGHVQHGGRRRQQLPWRGSSRCEAELP